MVFLLCFGISPKLHYFAVSSGLTYNQSWSSKSPTDDSFKNLTTWLIVQSGGSVRAIGEGSSKTLVLTDFVAGHSAITWKEDSSSSKHSLQEWGSSTLFCRFLCLFSLLCPVRNCTNLLRLFLTVPCSTYINPQIFFFLTFRIVKSKIIPYL